MKCAIIGWWAAGMMAAATLCEEWYPGDIHLFEKNSRLGAKVLISGGGRCNVTTGYFKKNDLQHKYIRGREFLEHAMGKFWPRKVYQRVEEHGVPLKCEKDMRVFPVSDNGADVVGIFEKIFREKNVQIHFKEWATWLRRRNGGEWFILTTPQKEYEFDQVILTTGGNAYAHTGSNGEGYDLAATCGHTVTRLGPSLNSFLVKEQRVKELSWISFVNAKLSYETYMNDESRNQKWESRNMSDPLLNTQNLTLKTTSCYGPLLLTHFGITGPTVFTFSAHTAFEKIDVDHPLSIQFATDAEKNTERRWHFLTDQATRNPKKQIDTSLGYELPHRFVEKILLETKINNDKKMGDLTRDEKHLLAKTLGDGVTLTLIARRPGDEFVTAGGISTDEISNETMESLLCPGLYFAGELVNMDGVTGGYNLQACRATGRAAGMAVAKK